MYISRTNIIEHIPEFEADIVLVCCAGYPNYGDELLLKSWLDNIFLRDSKIKVLVECPVPGNCSVLLGDYDGDYGIRMPSGKLCGARLTVPLTPLTMELNYSRLVTRIMGFDLC